MAAPISSIEIHPQKHRIVEQLIAGVSLRKIAAAANPPISHSALSQYSQKVVKPFLRGAEAARQIDISPSGRINPSGSVDVKALRQSVQSSPVRSRLEKVWAKTDQFLDESTVDNGAPILNSATRQIELLAKITGELTESAGASVSINIVCPAGPEDRMDLSGHDAATFEVSID